MPSLAHAGSRLRGVPGVRAGIASRTQRRRPADGSGHDMQEPVRRRASAWPLVCRMRPGRPGRTAPAARPRRARTGRRTSLCLIFVERWPARAGHCRRLWSPGWCGSPTGAPSTTTRGPRDRHACLRGDGPGVRDQRTDDDRRLGGPAGDPQALRRRSGEPAVLRQELPAGQADLAAHGHGRTAHARPARDGVLPARRTGRAGLDREPRRVGAARHAGPRVEHRRPGGAGLRSGSGCARSASRVLPCGAGAARAAELVGIALLAEDVGQQGDADICSRQGCHIRADPRARARRGPHARGQARQDRLCR